MSNSAQAAPRTRAPGGRHRPSVRTTMVWVGTLACAAALAIGGGLSLQMAAGQDPALGPKAQAGERSKGTPGRRLVNTTTVVRRRLTAPAPTATGAGGPATTPPPTPQPAPVPAPVQTSTS